MKKIAVIFAIALLLLTGCSAGGQAYSRPPAHGTDASAPSVSDTVRAERTDYRCASGVFGSDGTTLTSVTPNSIAIADGKKFRSGTLTCKVRSVNSTDSGIVFCLSGNGEYFWEQNVSYYFYFIGQGGTAYLGKVNGGGWFIMNKVDIAAIDPTHEYTLKVVVAENRMTCFVDGELMFGVKDADFLPGDGYGIRTGAAGVAFSQMTATTEFDYSLGGTL